MCSIYVACGVLQTPNLKYFIRGELRIKKNIIWGINIIVIIIIVFLVSCIFRNNANESNDIKTVKNTATVKKRYKMVIIRLDSIVMKRKSGIRQKSAGYLLWILLV